MLRVKRTKRIVSTVVSAAMVLAFTPVSGGFATEGASTADSSHAGTAYETQTVQIASKGVDQSAGEGTTAGKYRIVSAEDRTVIYVECSAKGKTAQVPASVTLSDGQAYSVVAVGEKAFYGNQSLKSVEIANTVKTIGTRAFDECVNLKSVTLSKGLQNIGVGAFFYCTRLSNISLPSTVKVISKNAFYGCLALTSVRIPAKVIKINNCAFSKCSSLAKVTGCKSLRSIACKGFAECSKLKRISLPSTLKVIGERAFYECKSLAKIDLANSLKTLGKLAFYDCKSLTSVRVPVAKVSSQAFESCKKLSTVKLSPKVKSVGYRAFGETAVKAFKLGKNTASFEPTACDGSSVESYKVTEGNKTFKAVNGVLYNKKTKKLVACPLNKKAAEFTVLAGTKAIGNSAFANISGIASIVLPKGLKRIGTSAFDNCAVTQLSLPNSVRKLGPHCFGNVNVVSLTIPKKVKVLPESAFSGCCQLKSVNLSHVKTIKSHALSYCSALKEITLPASVKRVAGDAFSYSIKSLKVAAANKAFTAVSNVLFSKDKKTLVCYPSSRKGSSYAVPKGTKVLGPLSFAEAALSAVSFPASLTTIRKRAFSKAETLFSKGFTVPSTVTSIGKEAIGFGQDESDDEVGGMLICCEMGSAAQKYAAKHDMAYAPATTKFAKAKISLSAAGATKKVTLSNAYSGTYSFYSSDTNIATVSDDGTVTAVGGGTTYIVAAMGTHYIKCEVSVGGEAAVPTGKYANYRECTYKDYKEWESEYYEGNQDVDFDIADNPAIRCYTTDQYVAILAALGEDRDYKDNFGNSIQEYTIVADDLLWELSKYNLPMDTKLFSGTSGVSRFTGTGSTLQDMSDSIGRTVTDKSMISTSISEEVAYGFSKGAYATVMQIYAPAGSVLGGYIAKFSAFPDEAELLLGQGATFKIVDAGVRYTECISFEGGVETSENGFERYFTMEYAGEPEVSTDSTIALLHTNDVHCEVDYDVANDSMGYAGLAAVLKSTQQEYGEENTALVDAGDAIQGGALGALTQGESIVKIMNELGYDASAIGNHEYDYGVKAFEKLKDEVAKYPYVSCNFRYAYGEKKGQLVYDPYVIQEVGGKKIAYVGITTPSTLTEAYPSVFKDSDGNQLYDFCNDSTGELLYQHVQAAVDAARSEGADYVVALAHLGQSISEPWRSYNVVANTSGIDIFVDGHSHNEYIQVEHKNKLGQVVPITQTGTKLQAAGKIVLDTASNTVTLSMVDASQVTEQDPSMAAYIAEAEAEFQEILGAKVGHTDYDLEIYNESGSRIVRRQETNLGDLVADGVRDYLDCDIAVVNGGGVRTTIKSGDISKKDLLDVMPFGNVLSSAEITGQQLLDMLELSVYCCDTSEFGGFLQVSGLTFDVDVSVPTPVKLDGDSNFVSIDGNRRVSNVKVNGADVDVSKTYTLGTVEYLLTGGNGYTMLKGCKIVKAPGALDIDAFSNYIVNDCAGEVPSQYSNIYGQGRINFK